MRSLADYVADFYLADTCLAEATVLPDLIDILVERLGALLADLER
jgi:hypothetical protein